MPAPPSAAAPTSSSAGGHGTKESERLKTNCDAQLSRLLTQLSDLEGMRGDMDADEFEAARADTVQQMEEFQKTLDKLVAGDVSLVSALGSMRLAVRQAILGGSDRGAIQELFSSKSTSGLRGKLASLEEDLRLQRISAEAHASLSVDILRSLDKLGETLSARERELLARSKGLEGYEVAGDEASDVGSSVVEAARR